MDDEQQHEQAFTDDQVAGDSVNEHFHEEHHEKIEPEHEKHGHEHVELHAEVEVEDQQYHHHHESEVPVVESGFEGEAGLPECDGAVVDVDQAACEKADELADEVALANIVDEVAAPTHIGEHEVHHQDDEINVHFGHSDEHAAAAEVGIEHADVPKHEENLHSHEAPVVDERTNEHEHGHGKVKHVDVDVPVPVAVSCTFERPSVVEEAAPTPAPAPVPVVQPTAVNRNDDNHQPATVKPSAMLKEKSPSPGAAGDTCSACGKKVYPLEKLVADKYIFHKTCFRCKKCNRTLSNSNYATLNTDFYCKPHQLELFRLQGRYEVSEMHAEVVNRSTDSSAGAADSSNSHESAATNGDDLRRARAMFEQQQQQQQHSPSPTAQHDVAAAQFGGVGALKSRFLANASQNADQSRPAPRKITPPRQDVVIQKTNGGDQSIEHGEFENDPVKIEGLVRETDRTQVESEMPKQGSAKSALAVFRNLESSGRAGSANASVNVSVSHDKSGAHLEADATH